MYYSRMYMIAVIGILFYVIQPGSSLFSWHPTFFTLGMCLYYESVLLFNPKLGLFNNLSLDTKRNIHSISQILAVVLTFIGFTAVLMAKVNHKMPHFESYHSKLGFAAGCLAGFQIAGGLATRFEKLTPISPITMKTGHRIVGLFHFLMHSSAFFFAIYSDYVKERTTPFIQFILSTLPIVAFVTCFSKIIHKTLHNVLNPK